MKTNEVFLYEFGMGGLVEFYIYDSFEAYSGENFLAWQMLYDAVEEFAETLLGARN